MWVFEMWLAGTAEWVPMLAGAEAECRERRDWYATVRPDLVSQLNVRDVEVDPSPPPAPSLP